MSFHAQSVLLLLFLNILRPITGFVFNGFELRDLNAGDTPNFELDLAEWNLATLVPGQNYTFCAGFPYVGGPNILQGSGTYSQRIYKDLPPHNVIYFGIFMVLFDNWSSSDSIVLQFGPNAIHLQNFITGSSALVLNYCSFGTNQRASNFWFYGRVFHDLPELDFRIISYLNGPSSDRSFSFRNIYMSFANKPSGMTELICANSASSLTNYDCGCTSFGLYKDSNGNCQSCHTNCAACFGPLTSECVVCNSGYFFDGTNCILCPPECPVCHGTTVNECNTCASGYFLIGTTCTATCDPPLVETTTPAVTCTYPCEDDEYLFPDHSCGDKCPDPLDSELKYVSKQFCKNPCGSDYAYFDNYCNSQCDPPFTPTLYHNLKICKPPVCGPSPCIFCNNNNDCPDYHTCTMTSLGKGLCMSYITYTLESDLLKSILNGYMITVNVVPTLNLVEGPNDMLIVEVNGLEIGNDYTLNIQRLSKGTFIVTIQVTHAIERTLQMRFTYSPEVLNLKSQLSLPQIVYISPELEKAAEAVQTASVVGFGIMIINSIGFVMSGGLATIWSFLPENQYTYYLLYLNVDHLYHTKAYFRSLANYDMLLDVLPNDEEDDENKPESTSHIQNSMPIRFVEEDYSPRFQQNAGQVLITLAVIAAAIAIVTVLFELLAIPRRSYWAHRILKIIRRIIRWNGIIRQLLSYALAVTLASFIQLYVELFGGSSTRFSTFLSILALLIVFIGFRVMSSLLKNIPTNKFERVIYSEWYGTLWEDLNLDAKKTRYYYLIVSLRGVLLSYVAVFFDVFPLVQIVVLISYQCFIISLFLDRDGIQEVFETKSLNLVSLVEEILLFVMKIMILISYVMRHYTTDNDTLILIGWIVIAPGLITQAIQCVYSTIKQIFELKTQFKNLIIKTRRFLNRDRVMRKIRRIHSKTIQRIHLKQ